MDDLTRFTRIGGEAAVEAAVNLLYRKIHTTPDLHRFFINVDMQRQEHKLRLLLLEVLGGNSTHHRDMLRKAHESSVRKGLHHEEFNLFLNLFRESLIELEIPKELVDEFCEIFDGYRDSVLGNES